MSELASLLSQLDQPLQPADYHRLARRLLAAVPDEDAHRVTFLGTCTLDFARPFLVVEGARLGFPVAPSFGPFGQLEQLILDDGSPLYRSPLDALVLVVRPQDLAPDVMLRPLATDRPSAADVLTDIRARLVLLASEFRRRSTAPCLIANFAQPADPPLGPLEGHHGESLSYAIAAANAALRKELGEIPDVAIWDLAGLVQNEGAVRWYDRRTWFLARSPVAEARQPALARHLLRTVRAFSHPPAKCLVFDLDNTIWGGVIGDDGVAGIRLGDDYPGNVFKDLQRRILALRDRGILLAVVSKNDQPVAEDAFRRHPEMLIAWEDLAATRINWRPKSENLREIARELNIGSDSLVFLDDNPVERAEVRLNAPDVRVIELPPEPLRYAGALGDVPWFDQVAISSEDRARPQLYRKQRERTEAGAGFADITQFLTSLEMRAVIGEYSDRTAERIHQLIGKTNQFNLTTRRHSAAHLAKLAASPNSIIAWIRVEDRFGDQGLVGVAIAVVDGAAATLDTLLMSCRVMNRSVEHALLSFVAERVRVLGCSELIGEYIPTAKNGMVSALYSDLGFEPIGESTGRFRLPLGPDALPWPDVIQRTEVAADDGP